MIGCKSAHSGLEQSVETSLLRAPCDTVKEPTETLIHRILSSLEIRSKEEPSRIAVIEGINEARKLTNGELRHRVLATASFLRSCGFGREDRAVIAIPNIIEFPIFHLGVWAVGGTIIGSSVRYRAYETQYQLVDSCAKIILTTEEYLPTIMGILDNCPSVEKVICIRSTSADIPKGVIDFQDVINYSIDGKAPEAHLDNVAIIYYTSGSTGLRKGVLLTHKSAHIFVENKQIRRQQQLHSALGMEKLNSMPNIRLVNAPCCHIVGLGIVNVCLISGATIVLINSFQDGTLVKCIEKYKPISITGTPAMVMHLTKDEKADLSSVKIVTTCSSYLKETVANAFLQRFPHVQYLVQAYGLTEAPGSHTPVLLHKGFNSSVGVLSPIFQRKIINVATHQPCMIGEKGEIYIKGPAQTIGYLNRPESTEQLIDPDGWIRTGDIGYVDELGQLYIDGRLKEMLKVNYKTGTATVSPSEIEDVIISSSKVADVGVVGIPHEEREFLLRAFVVKADDSLTAEEVENIVSEKLSECKFITGGVQFIDKMPRSELGKLQRQELLAISKFNQSQ